MEGTYTTENKFRPGNEVGTTHGRYLSRIPYGTRGRIIGRNEDYGFSEVYNVDFGELGVQAFHHEFLILMTNKATKIEIKPGWTNDWGFKVDTRVGWETIRAI